jgi:hypothetical protein
MAAYNQVAPHAADACFDYRAATHASIGEQFSLSARRPRRARYCATHSGVIALTGVFGTMTLPASFLTGQRLWPMPAQFKMA